MNRKDTFIRALNTYIQRNGENLTKQDIEPVVMNLAYLEVLQAKKSGRHVDEFNVLADYSSIANELFPQLNFQPEALLFGYQATIQWDGLWEFLQNYFISKLGWNIDENNLLIERFDSSSHTREEFGQFVSKSDVIRKVEIIFSENRKIMLVNIATPDQGFFEGLSEKKAILEFENGHKKVYGGVDPDYKFTIVYDVFGTIEKFILELLPRHLRITYHE
jgi:hypothetical protein